jgi:hypothetical protein
MTFSLASRHCHDISIGQLSLPIGHIFIDYRYTITPLHYAFIDIG